MIFASTPPDQIPTVPGLITSATLFSVWAVIRWRQTRRTG